MNTSLKCSNVEKLRKFIGYSISDICSFLSMSEDEYHHFCNNPSVEGLEKIADLYGIEEYDILTMPFNKLKKNVIKIKAPKNDMYEISRFFRIIKNYEKMDRLLNQE